MRLVGKDVTPEHDDPRCEVGMIRLETDGCSIVGKGGQIVNGDIICAACQRAIYESLGLGEDAPNRVHF